MRPPAAMTRLRRGRKPLQILQMKSFLIEAHERLTRLQLLYTDVANFTACSQSLCQQFMFDASHS